MPTQATQLHKRARLALALLAAAATVLSLAGCTIRESHAEGDKKVDINTPIGEIHTSEGKNKKVDISTPFGGIHVNTNDADPKSVGMTVYPGATVRQDHDDNSATVNMSMFGLKVVALKYQTADKSDKVLDFYRKELKSYGAVLECKGNDTHVTVKPGESTDLTCEDHGGGAQIHVDTDAIQLKAGTKDRQHIVEIKPRDNGTEFSLIYLQFRDHGGASM
jgi:hypothetical protein